MSNTSKLVQNIAGGISKSNIIKVGLAESINMFPETQNSSEHSCNILMRSIQGQVPVARMSGRCRGMYRVSRGYDNRPSLYAIFDTKLYLIYEDGSYAEIADINSHGTECHMCETGGYGSAHPHLVIVDGYNVYAVNTGLSVGDQQADFRTIKLPLRVNSKDTYIKPTHCAYLYGYLIVNDAGTDAFYTSYQYPFEVEDSEDPSFYVQRQDFISWWTELDETTKEQYIAGEIEDTYYTLYKDFITGTADDTPEKYDVFRVDTVQFANYGFITYSEWSPDNTIALCSNGSKLYTFGERSWQVFSYNDDVNNPFSSPDNAAGNIGIKAPNSLTMLGDNVIWLGSSDIGNNGIYMVSNGSITRISTQDIEREISEVINPENAYASIWQEHQHVFYSITFADSHRTYVYDITENTWHERASFKANYRGSSNDLRDNLVEWRYDHVTFAYGRIYMGTEGALVYNDENKFDEHDGRYICKMRRGSVLVNGDMPFYIDHFRLICNNGQTAYNKKPGDFLNIDGSNKNPRISFRYSWDGANFSDYEDAYMGTTGNYEYVTDIYGCGMGRYFTLEISTTESIPFAIENLQVSWAGCSNF